MRRIIYANRLPWELRLGVTLPMQILLGNFNPIVRLKYSSQMFDTIIGIQADGASVWFSGAPLIFTQYPVSAILVITLVLLITNSIVGHARL